MSLIDTGHSQGPTITAAMMVNSATLLATASL